jgi:hypothetical protein
MSFLSENVYKNEIMGGKKMAKKTFKMLKSNVYNLNSILVG